MDPLTAHAVLQVVFLATLGILTLLLAFMILATLRLDGRTLGRRLAEKAGGVRMAIIVSFMGLLISAAVFVLPFMGFVLPSILAIPLMFLGLETIGAGMHTFLRIVKSKPIR